jgi:dUTP pyrophosphatase
MSVILVDKNARIPSKSSEYAAGYDLRAVNDVVVGVGERKLVSTGLRLSCPEGTYGRIAPRSGLALKNGLDVMAGVVDPDYIGIVSVILINFGDLPVKINVGDRIAQLIFERFETGPQVLYALFEPDIVDDVDDVGIERTGMVRGSAGFGSSGIE